MDAKGCIKDTEWQGCTPEPLPEGTVKEKVAFLLKQPHERSIKDITRIIYPNVEEHSQEFDSKYSYVRRMVAELRGHRVHFHRTGRYRLVWQGRPVALNWLIGCIREILLGNNKSPPEWMDIKSFFNILDVAASPNGRKYVGDRNYPCTFEVSRTGYVTIYVHDKQGDWEDWLFEQLINRGWPEGLVIHMFQYLEPTHHDEHMTIDGFSWPREMRGKAIKTPYGWTLKFGDGSHPDALEMEFKENIGAGIRRLNTKVDILLKLVGWVEKEYQK